MTSCFIFGDISVENENLSYFAEIKYGGVGKIEKLITKMSLD